VRLLLDAHVSGRRVGRPLRTAGHDVLALDEDESLSRLPDVEVLSLAADQARIVITYNVSDFARIAGGWAEAMRNHAGLILLTESRAGFGAILRGIEGLLAARPRQYDWIDRVELLGRG
jgi:hypothetical protein